MNTGNPAVICGDILHVRIGGSENPVRDAHVVYVPHEAFRNDGLTGYHSSALDAIKETCEEWLFFDWWTGGWVEADFRTQLEALIRENPCMNGALFDEMLAGEGSFAFSSTDPGSVYDYYGNIPSTILIRRDAFYMLMDHLFTLFPYPVQKLKDTAEKMGLKLEIIHTLIRKLPCAQLPMMVSGGRQITLRGKNREKKLLVITHELSWTGAPLVLAEACIAVLKPAGYEIMVLSQKAGPASQKYLDNGISVMTIPELASLESNLLYALIQPYDAVIVNTIVPFAAMQLLNTLDKPVFWWIHECELIYQWVGHFLPQQLADHIQVRCVGNYALDVLKRNRPDYHAGMLIYGLRDANPAGKMKQHVQGQRFRFATIGSLVQIKGQDVLAEAISLLSEEVREKCEFLFVGKTDDPQILAAVEEAQKAYPETVRYMGPVPRDVLDEIYPDVDCIICPSRSDCMPTFVAEGMMYGKTAICSENTGMAPILSSEDAGFIYSGDDPSKLAEAITGYVFLSEEAQKMYSQKARRCFEKHFALDVFRENLLQVLGEMLPDSAEKDR